MRSFIHFANALFGASAPLFFATSVAAKPGCAASAMTAAALSRRASSIVKVRIATLLQRKYAFHGLYGVRPSSGSSRWRLESGGRAADVERVRCRRAKSGNSVPVSANAPR